MCRAARFQLPDFGGIRPAWQRWRRRLGAEVVVLMYHRVAVVPCDPWNLCVSPHHFAEQLEVLKGQAPVISVSELSQALEKETLPRRAVVLTFDDGYADNLLEAKLLLANHDLPATLFLSTGSLDSPYEFWWDEVERIFLLPGTLPETLELTINGRGRKWSLGAEASYDLSTWERHRTWLATTPPETVRQRVYYEIWDALRTLPAATQEQLLNQLASWARQPRTARPTHRSLTSAEAQNLISGGLFQIGAHTVSHPALSAHPRQVQEQEIRASKEHIESQLGQPVHHFAYPYGDYSAETVAIVREIGFSAAFTTDHGCVINGAPRWQLPRWMVCDWDGEEFTKRLAAMF